MDTAERRQPEEPVFPELYEGISLRVLTLDNRLIFVGRVAGIQGDTIQIFDDKGIRVPDVVYNTKVKLKGFSENQAFTLEGVISGSTEAYWWIEHLRSLQGAEQRAFFRQSAHLEAAVMGANLIFGGDRASRQETEGVPFPCKVVDLSAGGAMIQTRADYRVGDWLLLVNMEIEPNMPPATFTCIVRRVIGEDRVKKYGCEFYMLDGNEREGLIRTIFKFQRKELQDRRGDGAQ